jgi:hypothetical protein
MERSAARLGLGMERSAAILAAGGIVSMIIFVKLK